MKISVKDRLYRSIVALVLSLALVFCLFSPAKAAIGEPSVSASSAILIDMSDQTVIYEKNARERMGMASTTKIMTALVISELLPLDKRISIPAEAVNVEGSSVYLTEGELLTVEQLLYALLLASANDAATALAIAAMGSVESFAEKMNEQALAWGLCDTHFTNPHGLFDEQHYTTAYDLALISAKALGNPTIKRIASSKKAIIPQGVTPENLDGSSERYLYNHNKMLSLYDGAIGLKTGFTKATGRCLVSAAERDGMTLISVTLDAPNDWNDHALMLDFGFSLYERVTLYDVGEFSCPFSITGGKEAYVTLTNSEPITLTLPKARGEANLSVSAYRRFEFAPITKGRTMAWLTVSLEGKSISSPLVSAYSIEAAHKK